MNFSTITKILAAKVLDQNRTKNKTNMATVTEYKETIVMKTSDMDVQAVTHKLNQRHRNT